MECCPRSSIADEDTGPKYRMEVDVVFAHELVQLHILRIEPPFTPLRSICRRNTWISEWRVVLYARVSMINVWKALDI